MNKKKYHKIDSLFQRDMEGNKKLIMGQFRNPVVEYIKDCQWRFTEKIDGTNIRVMWDGHKVQFAGRTDNADLHKDLVKRLEELFGGQTNEQIFEQMFGEKDVSFYGEGYGAGIQSGGDYLQSKDFVMFDIEVQDMFLERKDVEEIAKSFNVKCVPIVLMGTIQQGIDFIRNKPESIFAEKKRPMEGIIGTPILEMKDKRGNRIIVKIKVEDFIY